MKVYCIQLQIGGWKSQHGGESINDEMELMGWTRPCPDFVISPEVKQITIRSQLLKT
jgi:hypothetical protein